MLLPIVAVTLMAAPEAIQRNCTKTSERVLQKRQYYRDYRAARRAERKRKTPKARRAFQLFIKGVQASQ